jgi:hypothetical protein
MMLSHPHCNPLYRSPHFTGFLCFRDPGLHFSFSRQYANRVTDSLIHIEISFMPWSQGSACCCACVSSVWPNRSKLMTRIPLCVANLQEKQAYHSHPLAPGHSSVPYAFLEFCVGSGNPCQGQSAFFAVLWRGTV